MFIFCVDTLLRKNLDYPEPTARLLRCFEVQDVYFVQGTCTQGPTLTRVRLGSRVFAAARPKNSAKDACGRVLNRPCYVLEVSGRLQSTGTRARSSFQEQHSFVGE